MLQVAFYIVYLNHFMKLVDRLINLEEQIVRWGVKSDFQYLCLNMFLTHLFKKCLHALQVL